MQLIEGRACDLPMVLFVHVPQRDRVGKDLVEILHVGLADVLLQSDRQFGDHAVGLDLCSILLQNGPHTVENALLIYGMTLHGVPSFTTRKTGLLLVVLDDFSRADMRVACYSTFIRRDERPSASFDSGEFLSEHVW